MKNETYTVRTLSTNNRSPDLLSGEFSVLNENNCGIIGGTLSATLIGGGASIRVSKIEDLIRARSTNYEHWTDSNVTGEYNDQAYINKEKYVFSYQGERLGDKGLTASGPIVGSASIPVIPHPRAIEFSGALGTVETKFVQRPEQNRITKDSKEKKPEDEGVFSSHIGEAGELIYRSAGGISIERYDRIPSVRRIRKPYDPEGDKEVKHNPITPFKYNEIDPSLRPLELFDALAWEQKGVYQRFDEQEKDFRAQEEQDIKTPGNANNDPAGSSSNMQQNSKKRCGIYLEQNGGITIRDAWGSEISLVGGNIYLNAAASIVMTANKSIVSFAKDTNVMKAKNIAAMESMKYSEIRGVSYVNIHGGYSGGNGGVLIESFGDDDVTVSPPGAGHGTGVNIRGITLKSKAGVHVKSNTFKATVDSDVVFGCGKERDGRFIVSGGNFYAISKFQSNIGTEKAMFSAQSGSLIGVASGSVFFGATGGFTIVKNGNQGVIMQTTSTKASIKKTLEKVKDQYKKVDPNKITIPYSWDDYEAKICSQLGKSIQYNSQFSIDLRGGKFRMYLPYWHTMKNDGNEFVKNVEPEPWPEYKYPVYDNLAWPGKIAWDEGEIAVLDKSKNIEGGHYSKKRSELNDSTNVQIKKFKDYFRV
jgi:hypothetical protein